MKAPASGYFNDPDRLTRMTANRDFDPISTRDDFKTLLAEWERKNPPKAEVLPPRG